MKRTASFALALLGFTSVTIIAGCGGGSGSPAITAPPLTVSVSADSTSVPAGGQANFTATVSNDPSGKGVTWTVSCSASSCGSVSSNKTPSATATTYTAPSAPPPSDLTVTVKATSVADTSKSGSATITVVAITVSVSPTTATVQAGGVVPINANANNDPSGLGVTWTISPASGAGTLSNATNTSVTYNAPASPPASDLTVTITATSVADASKAGSTIVTVPTVVVSVTPTAATVQAGGTQTFTAAVQNDPAHKGVTWTLSPASGAGTLSNVTSTSVTYNAPASPPASDLTVTVTATSIADTLGSSSATVTVPAITVSVMPTGARVQAGGTQPFTATVQNDPTNKGVTWTLSPASGAGTLSNVTSTSVTYNAPASPPASDLTVTLTATSMIDTTKSAFANITVPAITVSVSPGSALIPVNATQQLAATVQNDPANKGVTWALSPASGTGTLSNVTSTSVTYNAPASLPTNAKVALTGTSVTDMTKSAGATITLTIGTVKLVPASLDFGQVKFNKTKKLTTTLTNTGSTTLSVTSITITGTNTDRFSETNNCLPSVATGNSCSIGVTFTPKTVGSFSADLSISDSSTDSPQQVTLSGRGCFRCFIAAAVRSALATNKTAAVPGPTGPSNVGTRVMDLVDATRSDPYLANSTKRDLLVRFWYPVSVSQGCKPAEYATPTIWSYFSQLVGIPLPEVKTNSCLNAPIAEGAHPIIAFTHGYTGTFTDYTFLFEDLASRGYVVASVDHTYEATAVAFPDGRFVKSVFGSHLGKTMRTDEQAFSFAVSVRLSDLKFVLNELERLNASAESPFAGKLDMSRVALAGHSLGGMTALLGVEEEPRRRAGIFIDGVVPDSLFTATEKPVLILAAGREQWGDDECRLWSELRGPRLAVNLKGSEHVTPSDAVWLANGVIKTGTMGTETTIAAVRNYIAAFLDVNLRGKPVDPLLTGPSSDYPDADVTTQTQSPCGEARDRFPR
jgi:dienelactone hydrolase